jgi:hypothetical protein
VNEAHGYGTELALGEAALGAAAWHPVRAALTDDHLRLESESGPNSWPLTDVTFVDEESSPSNGQFILVRMRDGFQLRLRVSDVFIAAFLERLASTIERAGPAAPTLPRSDLHTPTAQPPPFEPTRVVGPPPFQTQQPTMVHAAPPAGNDEIADPPAAPAGETAEKRKWATRRFLAITAASLLVVGLLAATLTYRSKYEASSELADRTAAELAETTAALDESEASLAKTTAELAEMTSDRDDQTQRVAELSNEKAQIQDERNASQELARLGAVAAQEMQNCRNQLLDVMTAMFDSSIYVVNAMLDAVVPVCQAANSSVAAFSDAAG